MSRTSGSSASQSGMVLSFALDLVKGLWDATGRGKAGE
jgi:hypothetical protein